MNLTTLKFFQLKKRNIFLIIGLIIIADQALKIYIKTHYHPGESHSVIGNWFQLSFIENAGMAYGWKFGGGFGKIVTYPVQACSCYFWSFLFKENH